MLPLFFIPANLGVLLIACLMTFPFWFFNKYLQKKISPRENAKRLLIYIVVIIAAVFIYITIGVFLIVGIAKLLQ
jgi:predicted PurR-regulated permease PerM